MSSGGRGGRGRKNNRQKRSEPWQPKKRDEASRFDRKGAYIDRLKWTPPVLSAEPIPQPECPYCGKPITDLAAALDDKVSGRTAHFDCVLARVAAAETIEPGDQISYIGGGRFGVIRFTGKEQGKPQSRAFTIKRILEWENKDQRADWRRDLSDHYSLT